MSEETVVRKAEELIPVVAKQMSLQNPVDLLRQIYRVPVRWVAEVFKMESSIVCVTNGRQLEEALNKPEVNAVFVPKGSGINLELIQRIIDRASLRKNVFVEGV